MSSTEFNSPVGTRIHVIGNSASGKSTLAARLASALDAPLVELDAINWRPGWVGLAVRSSASRGTMKTVIEGVNAIRIRRGGDIRRVIAGSMRHEFDFGHGPTGALVTPLADVSTAWWSTGIENIETYSRAGRRLPRLMRLSRWFGWLLAGRPAQALLAQTG